MDTAQIWHKITLSWILGHANIEVDEIEDQLENAATRDKVPK